MNDYPSLFEQGKNLSKFALDLVRHIKSTDGKDLMAGDDLFQERMNICIACDRYDQGPNRCKECGCYLDVKARLILDSCPLKKWTESTENWDDKFSEMLKEMEEKSEN